MRRLVLALALAAAPQARAADVSSFTLDNGMEVVVLEDHRAPVVVHMVWYRVGSADEERGRTGLAHFLEHLMFKGTDTLAAGEFSKTVAANGGTDNAFTSQDYTAYIQRVAADRLDLMMKMEADRMVNLDIDASTVLTERDVVLEERNMRVENEPGALLSEQRMAAQYLNHPYGVPTIGWRNEVETLTQDEAVAFYKAHYAPNNAVLVVAGDVTEDEVRRLAEEYYGPTPANPAIGPRVRPQEPVQLAERRLVYEDPRVAQPVMVRTYLVPERDPGDQREAAALTMLAEVLGGSPTTSVLPRKLQFDSQVAIASSAFYDGTSYDDTLFGFYAVPAPGVSLQEAEDALDRAVAEFLDEGIDPATLDRLRRRILAGLIYAEDDLSALTRKYGSALTSGLTIEDVKAWPELLTEVTAEEIVAAGRKWLDRRHAVTSWSRPPSDGAQAAAAAPANVVPAQEVLQ